MRIALYHNLPSGGAKRAVFEWTRRLADRHEIDVYTLSSADQDFCDIRPMVDQHKVLEFVPHRLFTQRGLGRLNRLQRWRDLGELTRIGRHVSSLINGAKYDVVFAHACLYTFIPVFLRFLDVPSVYYLHEPFGPTFVRRFERPYLKPSTRWRNASLMVDPFFLSYTHRLEASRRSSLRATTLLIANSRYTQQHMRHDYGVEAPVCSYGVDTQTFRPMPMIAKDSRLVVSVGALMPRKGFDFLVQSLAHIPSGRRPCLTLVSNWVSEDERDYLVTLAGKLDVELRMLADLNSEELAVEFNRASLCLYSPVMEALGLVPLEAMACGTPVVGVGEGGVRETVVHGETGLLTERNPHLFAEAVDELLHSPEKRARYGCQGRKHVVEQWNWDRSANTIERYLVEATQ